jgi:hypothetical protein
MGVKQGAEKNIWTKQEGNGEKILSFIRYY